MKSKMIKIALASLLISQSISVLNAETLSQNSGALNFLESEFPANALNYPTQINDRWRAVFNGSQQDRMFMHTFKLNIPKHCKVSAASLQVQVKNLGAQNYNDNIYMTNQGTSTFGQKIWYNANEGVGFTKTLYFNLGYLPTGNHVLLRTNASILNSLNDGLFSFMVQDDTSIQRVRLDYKLAGKDCGDTKPDDTKPDDTKPGDSKPDGTKPYEAETDKPKPVRPKPRPYVKPGKPTTGAIAPCR